MTKKCSLLWNHARVHVDGSVLPCCNFDATQLTDEHPSVPKISDGIDNAFKSELFNNVRMTMLEEQEHPGCQGCYAIEKTDGADKSMRVQANKEFSLNCAPKIRYLETALSRHCNLACRMCGEDYSSKWFQYLNPKEKVDTSLSGSVVDYYDGNLTELNHVKFVGGEPMIDKNHVSFLENIFNKSNKSDMVLAYHTNGTVKPSKDVISLWEKAEQVIIRFSLDGVGRTNEILRPPHKWETILSTIEYMKNIKSVNFQFEVHTVLSVGNVFKLKEIIEFSLETFNIVPSVYVLEWPQHLSIINQSDENKQKISEYINSKFLSGNVFSSCEYQSENIISVCNYVLGRMTSSATKVYTRQDIIDIENKHHYFKDSISATI